MNDPIALQRKTGRRIDAPHGELLKVVAMRHALATLPAAV